MSSLVFEDLHEYDGKHTAYTVCNESVKTWRKALDGISVDTAAGICSGGEVSFFALLPVVKQSLLLIDHSYASMYYAIGKYRAIEKLGAEKAYELFTKTRNGSYSHESDLHSVFAEANDGLPTKKHSYADLWGLDLIFRTLSKDDVEAFRANREKATFLHGDLNDLIDRGPFDLVYLSNALDYSGRNGKNFRVQEMVKPGGLVALTHGRYSKPASRLPTTYEVVFSESGDAGDGGSMSWQYSVCKAPE